MSDFQLTPSPSPGRIFAPPITPIVLDSSPTSLPLRSPFANSPTDAAPANDSTSAINYGNDVLGKRAALAESHGRENWPLSSDCQPSRERENGCAIPPDTNCSFPPAPPSRSKESSQVDDERGNVKTKQKITRVREGKRSKATANKTINGRVGKASAGSTKSSTKLTGEIVPSASVENTRTKSSDEDCVALQLEEAMKRRILWTPTKDTTLAVVDLTDLPSSTGPGSRTAFGDLISRYSFDGDNAREQEVEYMRDGPTKKRRLGLVETNGTEATSLNRQTSSGSPTSESQKNISAMRAPVKVKKQPKSKPTTITSLTTAPYETRNPPQESNLCGYASPQRVEGGPTKKRATKSRSAKSTKDKNVRSKKAENPPAPRVAPASDALKTLDDQVFLFGTCSQLARDSSPGPIAPQDRETAIQPAEALSKRSSRLGTTSTASKPSGSRSLWSASARDLNDDLADIEIVNLESPDTLRPDHVLGKADNTGLSSYASSTIFRTSVLNDGRNRRRKNELVSNAVGEDAEERDGPQPSNLPAKSSSKPPEPIKPQTTSCDKPHYRGFSTAELAKQVADFGFKPIKNREKAISLLEKCWESQNGNRRSDTATSKPACESQSGTSTAVNDAKISASSKPSAPPAAGISVKAKKTKDPTKAASKPQKTKTSTTRTQSKAVTQKPPAPVLSAFEEIADSTDEDTIPTPSRDISYDAISYSSQLDPEPTTLSERTLRDSILSTPRSTNKSQESTPEISKQITLAIRAQPRMRAVGKVKQPTWHEKILMYNPIWLDDLTVWLNTEGLGRIGEDREVDRLTVREWCESKGVCCTWRKAPKKKGDIVHHD